MKEIKTILIDDEASALSGLRGMLTEFCPEINIAGEASTVKEAIQAITQIEPELIFLDIEMPPFSGFELLELTRNFHFGVIFTTAYPQYAMEAINLIQPWSYLIKPYSIDKLMQTVNIANKKIAENNKKIPEPISAGSDNQGIIIQDSRKGNIVVKVRDILYCKSDGAALEIFAQRNGKTEKFLVYRTLKDLETQLPEAFFCRVHHSFIVNLAFIERYEITRTSRTIYLYNGAEIPISIQKSEQFGKKISEFLQ